MTSPPIPIHCSAVMPLPPMSFGIGPVIAEVEMNTSTDQDATTVQPTVVQACSMLYDTPATLDKAEKLTAEAAGYGSQLVLFPEVFVGGYPHGSAFGLTVGNRSAKGKEDFWKYHASAIDVPEHTLVCPGGTSIISPSRAVFAGPNYEGGHLLRADLRRTRRQQGSAAEFMLPMKSKIITMIQSPASHTPQPLTAPPLRTGDPDLKRKKSDDILRT